jgi:hypothetical protein
MITVALLRSWDVCWTGSKIAAVAGGVTAMSPRELAAHTDISPDDRMWVLGRTLRYLDERAARLYAIDTALTVAHLVDDEEPIFRGFMNDLLYAEDLPPAARDAVRDAAWDIVYNVEYKAAMYKTVRTSAWSVAYDIGYDNANIAYCVALSAARTVAYDASWHLPWGNMRTATWEAAYTAAIERSIARTLEWLGDYADGWEEP